MSTANINKFLRKHCSMLGIKKPITCYSFKRNSITIARLRGEKDDKIQKKAGWVSTKQLHTYDLGTQTDILDRELIELGMKKSKDNKEYRTNKICPFCKAINPLSNEFCFSCKQPLDINVVKKEIEGKENTDKEIAEIKEKLKNMEQLMGHGISTKQVADLPFPAPDADKKSKEKEYLRLIKEHEEDEKEKYEWKRNR
jgi:hypothetical protein